MIPDRPHSAIVEDVPVGSAKLIGCADQCLTCSDYSDHCEECEANRENAPTCSCVDGYFEETVDGVLVCSPCGIPCDTCQSELYCYLCDGNRENPSVCSCPAGTYDTNEAICPDCNTDYCVSCVGEPDYCEDCIEGRNSPPECPCNDGTYDLNGVCTPCEHPCSKCDVTATGCTECIGANRDENSASDTYCQCLVDYFENDPVTDDCAACNFKCDSCSNYESCDECACNRSGAPDCTTCDDGYFDDGVNECCQTCTSKYPNCVSCNAAECTVCTENRVAPECYCAEGYVEINGSCEPCNYNCVTCAQTTAACTECEVPRLTKPNSPDFCVCPDLYYEA